jgi:hypothetical protein
MANTTNHPKKQFCPKGHNTFVVGRSNTGRCRKCTNDYNKEYQDKNAEIISTKKKKHREEHPEVQLAYIAANKEKIAAKDKKYREGHKEEIKARKKKYNEEHMPEVLARNRAWNAAHPEKVRTIHGNKRAKRKLRVVAWTDWDNIELIYKNRPKNNAVDHIIPLCGELVFGLHVSWNLQYLTKSENSKKWKNINLTEASEWYGNILKEAGLK